MNRVIFLFDIMELYTCIIDFIKIIFPCYSYKNPDYILKRINYSQRIVHDFFQKISEHNLIRIKMKYEHQQNDFFKLYL